MAPAADDLEGDARTDGAVGDQVGDRLIGRDRLAVDLDDHVALLKPGERSGSPRHERADDFAAVLGDAERRRDILVDGLEAGAEIATRRQLPAHQ